MRRKDYTRFNTWLRFQLLIRNNSLKCNECLTLKVNLSSTNHEENLDICKVTLEERLLLKTLSGYQIDWEFGEILDETKKRLDGFHLLGNEGYIFHHFNEF